MHNKNILKFLFNLLVFSAALIAMPATAKDQGTLEQCQQVKNKIQYYTDLRRSGGSSKTMENWKQSRDRYKDEYSDLSCTKWRNKLR